MASESKSGGLSGSDSSSKSDSSDGNDDLDVACKCKLPNVSDVKSKLAGNRQWNSKFCNHVFCQFSSTSLSQLNTHINQVHDIGDKVCSCCNRLVYYSNKRSGKLLCRDCGSKTKTSKQLAWSKFIDNKVGKKYQPSESKRLSYSRCGLVGPDKVFCTKKTIEIDEYDELMHLYIPGTYKCEENRLRYIYNYYKSSKKNMVVIRFNPDRYIPNKGTKYVKQSDRYLVHTKLKLYLRRNPPTQPLTVYYLFYHNHSPKIVKKYPYKMIYSVTDFSSKYMQLNADSVFACDVCVTAACAAGNGHLECLTFYSSQITHLHMAIHAMVEAARFGKTNTLRHLYELYLSTGYPGASTWTRSTMPKIGLTAAKFGRLNCVKYLHKAGYIFASSAAYEAARNNHVDVLAYIISHIPVYVEHINLINCAISKNALNCLILAVESLPVVLETFKDIAAVAHGGNNLATIKYLYSKNIDFNKYYIGESRYVYLNVIKYLCSKGFIYSFRKIREFVSHGTTETIRTISKFQPLYTTEAERRQLLVSRSNIPTSILISHLCSKMKIKKSDELAYLADKFDVYKGCMYDITSKVH
jgi:hypothetical protein